MAPTMQYPTYILAGIRNKFGRNLAAVFCFALIAANVFSGQYLVAGEVESVDQGVSRMGADLLVVPLEYTHLLRGADTDNTMAIVAVLPSTYRFDSTMLGDIGKVQGVAGVSPQLFVAAVSIPELSAAPIGVYGIDPETDFTIRPWLRDPLAGPLGTGEVVIGHDLRRDRGDRHPDLGPDLHRRRRPRPDAVRDRPLRLRLHAGCARSSRPWTARCRPAIPESLPET